jgi:acyl-[acyl-carrier-protein] desaturase
VQRALLSELEPVVGQLLERHLSQSKEWFPHELVPWSRGRDFEPDETWQEADAQLPADVRSSLFVNILTEDNLPYYSRTISEVFGRDSAWGEWVRRWTAEEGRHAIVIRDYLTVTRAIDPVVLERARMAQVECGVVPEPDTPHEGLVYVALQELATRIAHFNTGNIIKTTDAAGYKIMKRVSVDENFHHLFYRDLCSAALELDPSGMVMAIAKQVREFAMPGVGIQDFSSHARAIARAGIYDFQVHHDQILVPVVLQKWAIQDVTGLDSEAEYARDEVLRQIERVGIAARRVRNRRERAGEAPAGASDPSEFLTV